MRALAILSSLLLALLTGCGPRTESQAPATPEASIATNSDADAADLASADEETSPLDALISGLDPDAPAPEPWPLEPAPADWRETVPPAIALTKGFTAVTSVQEPRGDYESAVHIVSEDAERLVLSFNLKSGSVSGTDKVRARRVVAKRDMAQAHGYRMTYSPADPESFPGVSSLRVSTAVYRELQDAGRSHIDLAAGVDAVGSILAMTGALASDLEGDLVRTGDLVGIAVLVNGQRVYLPAIYAKGEFQGMVRAAPVEMWILADESNPLTLRAHVDRAKTQLTRIDFPAAATADALERALSERRAVEMWGVYFEFARADLQPESAVVLDEVANVLRRHPDWRVRIEGHTDNVGNDADNLELSRLRAEATRAELARRLGSDAAVPKAIGHGEARPRETNDTLAGRARNRRVELIRE